MASAMRFDGGAEAAASAPLSSRLLRPDEVAASEDGANRGQKREHTHHGRLLHRSHLLPHRGAVRATDVLLLRQVRRLTAPGDRQESSTCHRNTSRLVPPFPPARNASCAPRTPSSNCGSAAISRGWRKLFAALCLHLPATPSRRGRRSAGSAEARRMGAVMASRNPRIIPPNGGSERATPRRFASRRSAPYKPSRASLTNVI